MAAHGKWQHMASGSTWQVAAHGKLTNSFHFKESTCTQGGGGGGGREGITNKELVTSLQDFPSFHGIVNIHYGL